MKTLSFFISIIVALFVFTNNICAQNEVKVSNGKSYVYDYKNQKIYRQTLNRSFQQDKILDNFVAKQTTPVNNLYIEVLSPARLEELKSEKIATTFICDSYGKVKSVEFLFFKEPFLSVDEIERLEEALASKKAQYPELTCSAEEIFEEYKEYAKIIAPMVCDTGVVLDECFQTGKNVLFEGAQGTMLDIDYGTYPFVTSSHPGANGVAEGSGIGPLYINEAVGIVKAYTTRVGSGAFPTEIEGELADQIRERGHEYGTVTKRARRIGWFDAVVVNQSRRMSSLTGISLMLLDVLSGLKTLKICTAYELDGKIIKALPSTIKQLNRVKPVYEEMPGWDEDITKVTSFEELPENCQKYLRRIEELINCPIVIFSVGPDREQTIVLREIFK